MSSNVEKLTSVKTFLTDLISELDCDIKALSILATAKENVVGTNVKNLIICLLDKKTAAAAELSSIKRSLTELENVNYYDIFQEFVEVDDEVALALRDIYRLVERVNYMFIAIDDDDDDAATNIELTVTEMPVNQ